MDVVRIKQLIFTTSYPNTYTNFRMELFTFYPYTLLHLCSEKCRSAQKKPHREKVHIIYARWHGAWKRIEKAQITLPYLKIYTTLELIKSKTKSQNNIFMVSKWRIKVIEEEILIIKKKVIEEEIQITLGGKLGLYPWKVEHREERQGRPRSRHIILCFLIHKSPHSSISIMIFLCLLSPPLAKWPPQPHLC